MQKLLLALAFVIAFTVPAYAESQCKKETTRSYVFGAGSYQVVTNTTQVRLCGIDLVCGGACTIYMRKHTGSTINLQTGLGAAGHRFIDFSGLNGGGWPGVKLSTKGLFYDPATASTTRGTLFYELE